MSLAIGAQGTLLKIGDGASVEGFTTIPEVHKLTAPSIKFDLLDTTSHDSADGFKEYIPGLADGENIGFSFWFVPTNSVHQGLRDDSIAKTLRNFQVLFPGGGTGDQMDQAAYVTMFTPTADINTVLVVAAQAKVTGTVTWS
jgi:hypothetical protein